MLLDAARLTVQRAGRGLALLYDLGGLRQTSEDRQESADTEHREGLTLPMALSQGILGARMWHPTTLPPAGPARPSKAVTTAPGACDLRRTPTPAQRTRVQDPFVLFPAGTIDRGPAQHSSSGAVHSADESLLARWRENSTTAVRSPSADGPACIPMGKPRGLQPGVLLKSRSA